MFPTTHLLKSSEHALRDFLIHVHTQLLHSRLLGYMYCAAS